MGAGYSKNVFSRGRDPVKSRSITHVLALWKGVTDSGSTHAA